ncbi:hypothetical protein VP1G_04068 [Cytospora mali]|uniref:Carcinoembryonic antigen-related cell adhesion molecule 1 n=1 Tax=Cytospora mali TaxID=578113 RepID=A0A194UYH5_CYTMA|nr:hypothetical protein VP1G_04068 [Valsa mali var. pyri (nom. inval.)]
MKRVLGLAAIGCPIALVEAGSFKWNANNDGRRWAPAYETLGVMPLLASNPAPTSRPNLAEAKHNKRSTTDNTCAYIGGDPDYPLYCNPDEACVYNSVYSKIGCCPDTSTTCAIATTCYDSTDRSLYTTANGYTLWCGDSDYPYCKTHLYDDDTFTGYTLLGCAVAAGTDSVDYDATLTSYYSNTASVSASGLQTSLNAASSETSTTRGSSTASTAAGSSPTTSPLASATSKSSSTPIGAIVGGVVGGVAVIALFALGLVFLLRRKRRNSGANDGPNGQQPPVDPSGGYPPQSPPPQPAMQQYQQPSYQQSPGAINYAAAGPAMDNRSSIQKPGYNYNVAHSAHDSSMGYPPESPPPQSVSPGHPLPAYQASNSSTYAMTPQTETAYTYNQSQSTGSGVGQATPGNYHEMSTEPADRELRELP